MSSILNWDKQSVIAVIVGAAALVAWYAYGPKMAGEQPAQTPEYEPESAEALHPCSP